MIVIVFQGIKLAPRLFWQSVFQPSKAYDFFRENQKNQYIFVWAIFFSVFLLGGGLAVAHYYLYDNLLQSILFAFAVAFAVTFAFGVAYNFALSFEGAFALAFVFAGAGAFAFALAGAFPLALASAFAGAGAGAGAVAGVFAGTAAITVAFITITLLGTIFLSNGVASILLLISAVGWFIFYLYLEKKVKLSDRKSEFHTHFIIAGASFAIMPIFILHFPDYLLCLPLWWFQQRNMLKKCEKSKEFISAYRESLLFKHEMLYFQLPGLHKIMVAFARNKEIGIKKALEEINNIYWFSFQQKQVQKAVTALGKDHGIAHQYIHLLLEENNNPFLEILAKENRLVYLYLMLFEKADKKPGNLDDGISAKKEDDNNLAWLLRREKQEFIPEILIDRIKFVCREISKEKGFQFNDEMVNTMLVIHHLQKANSLKDFYHAVDRSGGITGLPPGISYFAFTEDMGSQLKKIKGDLVKIEAIERFETRRIFLNEQKEKFEALTRTADEIFYEPFQTIWKKALLNCSEVVAREIKLLQGSAVLSIDLRNKEILASEENRTLYFEIYNKGQELATNISITLHPDIPGIFFIRDTKKNLPVIESGTKKEISFKISARNPLKTTVKGTVTFSDWSREGKEVSFSFPITVLKKRAVFTEIQNPYIVCQP